MTADPGTPRPRRRRRAGTKPSAPSTEGDANLESSTGGATRESFEPEPAPPVEPATRRVGSRHAHAASPLVRAANAGRPDPVALVEPKRIGRPATIRPPDLDPATPPWDQDAWSLLRAAAAAREPLPSAEPTARGRRPRGGAILAGTAIAFVGVVAVLLATGGPAPSSEQTLEPRQTTSIVEGVAGSISIQETFDDLPMDSTLADPWTIDGDGPVRVAALPTSVDRSIRISSDASGAATFVCRPIALPPGAALRIAMDYRLGRSLPEGARVIELRAERTVAFALVIDAATGRVQGVGNPAAATSGPAASDGPRASADDDDSLADDHTSWRRVEVIVTGSGDLTWQANDVSGADAGSGSLPGEASGAGVDTMCIVSPAGAPAGWIAVDDLLIEG